MGRTAGAPHQLAYTILCEWCGQTKQSSREDTKTCGESCRLRMSRFRSRFGYEPDEPPGNITARTAFDLEIFRLIKQEQRRRKMEQEERDAQLAVQVVTLPAVNKPAKKKVKLAPRSKRKAKRRHMSVVSSK